MNNRFFHVLSVRPFLFLWLAEIFSQIATNMVNFVLIIVAYKLAQSNTSVSGIVLSFTIPAILFGMLAGVYVDRWNKKKVLFTTNILRTIFLLILALSHANLWLIYSLSFAISIVTQFFIPAETPIIPVLVKKNLLLSANALFGMGIYGSILIAYAMSGPFLIFFGETNVFLILGSFFAIAAFLISLIKIPQDNEKLENTQSAKITLIGELKKAFRVIAQTKEIYHSFFLLILSQFLILILAVLGPGFASQILNIQVDQFPILFVTPSALGMIVGAIVMGNFFHNVSKNRSATFGVFLAGFAMLCLPYGSKVESRAIIQAINSYIPPFVEINVLHIMIVLAFIMGLANALVFVPSNTLLQENTSGELRGKVYGSLNALVGVFSLIPVVIVGELADILGVAKVITAIGIGIIAIGIIKLFFHLKDLKAKIG